MLNRAEIKAEAKEIMGSAQVNPYIVTLLVVLIGFVLERTVDMIQGGGIFYSYDIARQ